MLIKYWRFTKDKRLPCLFTLGICLRHVFCLFSLGGGGGGLTGGGDGGGLTGGGNMYGSDYCSILLPISGLVLKRYLLITCKCGSGTEE